MTADRRLSPFEYISPAPQRAQKVRIAFNPNPELDRAVRGFLIPESAANEQGMTALGKFALHTLAAQEFHYDHSDNDGIRYETSEAALLARERLRLKEIADDHLPVIGMRMHRSRKNRDILLALQLGITQRQREILGGVVLSRALIRPEDVPVVGVILPGPQLAPPAEFNKHRLQLIESFAATRDDWQAKPNLRMSSPYFVSGAYLSEDRPASR